MLQDCNIQVEEIELLNNENKLESDMIVINFIEKQEFIEDCPFGNVV